MRTYSLSVVALMVLGVISGTDRTFAQSAPAPAAGQHIVIVGSIKHAEDKFSRMLFTGDDGRDYTLDMLHANAAASGSPSTELAAGTRIYVSGQKGTDGSIVVSRLQVLPAAKTAALPPVMDAQEPPDVTVRGTVEAIDLEHGSFVLRVNTHTRVVYVTPDTDTSGLGSGVTDRFPVQPGQRVTVGGALQPSGSLLAGLLTPKEDVNYLTPASQPNRVLFGTISSPANKLGRRDIKIRLADGTETKIEMPRGIPIRRVGLQISVYDLSRRDQVRVTGRIVVSNFHAFRLDILAPPPAPTSEPTPAVPSLPGL